MADQTKHTFLVCYDVRYHRFLASEKELSKPTLSDCLCGVQQLIKNPKPLFLELLT